MNFSSHKDQKGKVNFVRVSSLFIRIWILTIRGQVYLNKSPRNPEIWGNKT